MDGQGKGLSLKNWHTLKYAFRMNNVDQKVLHVVEPLHGREKTGNINW